MKKVGRKSVDGPQPECGCSDYAPPATHNNQACANSESKAVILEPDVAAAFPDDKAVNQALRGLLQQFGYGLQHVPPPVMLHYLMRGYWISQAICVAAQLRIADHLSHGPKSADDLAKAAEVHPRALYRLLRTLASVGIFTEVKPRHFGLTPMAELLRTGTAESVNALALWNKVDWPSWGQLLYSITTGKTAFQHVHGMEPFAYFEHNHELGTVFNSAMTGYAKVSSMAAVEAYDFTRFTTVVDIGGGHGSLMAAILQASPTARGIVFDRVNVIEGTRKVMEDAGLLQRCDCVGGNFFESVPPGSDAYILSSIIHDWDAERSLLILRNCRRAMEMNAMLLLVEAVIPPGDIPSFSKWLDLEMLVCFGGCERTESEYRELLAQAGFQLTRIVPTRTASSIIEAVPVPSIDEQVVKK